MLAILANNLLVATPVEVRVSLLNVTDSSAWASQTGIGYSMWDAKPGALSAAPDLEATNGTTDASGVFVVDVTGTYAAGTEVTVAIHKSAGGVGGEDDIWGLGVYDVTAT